MLDFWRKYPHLSVMENSWIKIIGATKGSVRYGKCLRRCKKPYIAAASVIFWADDQEHIKVKLFIDGHDYGVCKPPTRRRIWTEEVAIICMHIQDCLNIHEAFYRKILDLDEEKV